MTIRVLVLPASLPFSLRDLRAQAKLDGVDEDELGRGDLTTYLRAAVARYDGPLGVLGRALITQTLQLTLDAFPGGTGADAAIRLPSAPLQEVLTVEYLDPADLWQTLEANRYQEIGSHDPRGGSIRPIGGVGWPATKAQADAVRITWRAGYGDTPADIPAGIRNAYAMAVAHWRDLRQAGTSDPETAELPDRAKVQLDTFKVQ